MTDPSAKDDASNEGETWYELDSQDRIIGMGGAWVMPGFDRYVEGLSTQTVIGTRIFDHVSGHFTQRYLKEFLEGARTIGTVTRRSYRCDAPEFKRLMEMRIEKCGENRLRVGHRTLDERQMPFPIEFVTARNRRQAYTFRCSMCNRLQQKKGAASVWKEPELCVRATEVVSVIYTVCPDCRSGVSQKALGFAAKR